MQKESSEIHNRVSVENAFDEEKWTLGLVYIKVEKGCYNMWWN
jgi:hypothetical protein